MRMFFCWTQDSHGQEQIWVHNLACPKMAIQMGKDQENPLESGFPHFQIDV